VSALRSNAWFARLHAGTVLVEAGSRVEFGDDFIAEGAWAGRFDAEGLTTSHFVCGSGIAIKPGEVILAAPTHSLDAIGRLEKPRAIRESW